MRLASQHIYLRGRIEQVLVIQSVPGDAKALVPSQALELGGMGDPLHAGGERATLQAVPSEVLGCGARLSSPELEDTGDGAGRQNFGADRGEGKGDGRAG